MPRPRITPHYINIETPVALSKSLPASVKVTYLYLKALVWGDKDVIFTVSEFFEFFEISRSTLYRHLSLLAMMSSALQIVRQQDYGCGICGVPGRDA